MHEIWHDSSDKWDNVVGSMLKDLDDQNFELRIGALKMLAYIPLGKIHDHFKAGRIQFFSMLEKPDHPSVRKETIETMTTFLLYKFENQHIETFGRIWLRKIIIRLWEEPNIEVFISIMSKLTVLFREVMFNVGKKDTDLFKDGKTSPKKKFSKLVDFICRYIRPTKLAFIIKRINSVNDSLQPSLYFPIICFLKYQAEIIASGEKIEYIEESEFMESDLEISKSKSYQSGAISSDTVQETPKETENKTQDTDEEISSNLVDPPLVLLNKILKNRLLPFLLSGKQKLVLEVGKVVTFLSESDTTRNKEHIYSVAHAYIALLKGFSVPNTLIRECISNLLSLCSYIHFNLFNIFIFDIFRAILLINKGRLELLKKTITLLFQKNSQNYVMTLEKEGESNKLFNFTSVGDHLRINKWFQTLWDTEENWVYKNEIKMTLLQVGINRFQKTSKAEDSLFQIQKQELMGLHSLLATTLAWDNSQHNFQEQYVYLLDTLFQYLNDEQITDFINDIMKSIKKIKLDSVLSQVSFLVCKYHTRISSHSNELFLLLDDRIFKSRELFQGNTHSITEAGNLKFENPVPPRSQTSEHIISIQTIFLMGLKCKEKYPRIVDLLGMMAEHTEDVVYKEKYSLLSRFVNYSHSTSANFLRDFSEYQTFPCHLKISQYFPRVGNEESIFNSQDIFPDSYFVFYNKSLSGLSDMQVVSNKSLDLQRKSLRPKIVSGSSDPLHVEVYHLFNSSTSCVTLFTKVTNRTFFPAKKIKLTVSYRGNMKYTDNSKAQCFEFIKQIDANQSMEFSSNFLVKSVSRNAFFVTLFYQEVSTKDEQNSSEGGNQFAKYLEGNPQSCAPYEIFFNEYLNGFYCTSHHFVKQWNRFPAAFKQYITFNGDLTDLFSSLSNFPFQNIFHRENNSNYFQSAFASISWFSDIFLLFLTCVKQGNDWFISFEFKSSSTSSLSILQLDISIWLKALDKNLIKINPQDPRNVFTSTKLPQEDNDVDENLDKVLDSWELIKSIN